MKNRDCKQCSALIVITNKGTNRRFCDICRKTRRRESDRLRQRTARSTQEYKDKYKAYSLKRLYGISIEDFNTMFERQGKCCAICKSNTTINGKSLFVDHDHVTGKNRGILCSKCNFLIGLANDNPVILSAAIGYLNDHR